MHVDHHDPLAVARDEVIQAVVEDLNRGSISVGQLSGDQARVESPANELATREDPPR